MKIISTKKCADTEVEVTVEIDMDDSSEQIPYIFKPIGTYRLFPSTDAVVFVNIRSGLVVLLREREDGNGFSLEMYSLHNGSDSSSDYNNTLSCRFKDFEDAVIAMEGLIEAD